MKILKSSLPFLFLLILSFFAYKPIFHTGFFPIHDDTQVVRVNEMTTALKDGMFPVRWSQNLGYGYGYPIFNFYNPLPYYIGGVIEIFTKDALFATKFLFFIAIISSAISSYLLGKEFFGKLGGLTASVFYVYAPYHAVDIYVRGALAESFAYALMPILFFITYKIYKRQSILSSILLGISFALVVSSHNLTALIVTPFLLLFMAYLLFIKDDKAKLLKHFLVSLILGLVLSAFYFIPAILEMNYTNVASQVGGGADFKDHFVCIYQLWTSPWGYGGSVKGCTDGLSFMIGKYHLIVVFIITILSVFSLLNKKMKKESETLKIILLFTVFFAISVFMTLTFSKPIWELFKPLAFVQYPWRFLSIALLFASFIAGAIPLFVRTILKDKKTTYFLTAIVLGFIIVVNIKFFVPQRYLNVSSQNYLNNYSVKWITSKISDEYMPKNFSKPKNFYQIPDPNNLVTSQISAEFVKRKTQEIDLNINVIKAGNYVFPIAYFPSWKAYLDSKEIALSQASKGTAITLPKGKHFLRFVFSKTSVELASDLISLAGVLGIIAVIILSKLKRIKYE